MASKNSYIEFTKMQGTGNDFIIIDNRELTFSKERLINLAPEICDRHFGVGADGIISLQPPENDSVDYTMFYRNADGSDAGMCGNGARCLALFAHKNELGATLSFNVHNTVYNAVVSPDNQIEIGFPMEVKLQPITVNDSTIFKLYTGTEHIVKQISTNDLKNDDKLLEEGRELRRSDLFEPDGTNVNFIHGTSKNTLLLKTFEKGVEDLTLACGTGAIASALAWHNLVNPATKDRYSTIVQTDGGTLQVGFRYNEVENIYHDLKLTGKAQVVFTGQYKIQD